MSEDFGDTCTHCGAKPTQGCRVPGMERCVYAQGGSGNFRQVLDHGFVRLVDYMGTDLSVVRAARVSYNAAWRTGKDVGNDEKLIRFLWRNKHSTPFEAVTFTFEVKAPIFIFRQWHRHRTWSFNELSARYAKLPEECYIPELNKIGKQSTDNKQARVLDDTIPFKSGEQRDLYVWTCGAAFATYRQLMEAGWPRELARAVLPVSTYSKMFATVNLLNLFKFITLRNHAHAQYEIQVYAAALQELIKPIVPVCLAAFEEPK